MAFSSLPRDTNRVPVQLSPSKAAVAVTYNSSLANSLAADITLNTSTTLIEVTARDSGVFLRYASTASNATFDEYISVDQTRHYIVPNGVTVISVIGDEATARVIVIEK